MDLLLKIWRQKNRQDKGGLEDYKVTGISKDSSFLEMLDVLNENLINEGKEPVAFDHDCTIYIEPWRSKALPVVKDLVVDRSAFDRIQHAGGFISVNTSGNSQDANSIPIEKNDADRAFDAASCIGCAACVATCKNASAMLFVAAKVSQYAYLPQGQVERKERVISMVNQMDKEGFGNCTNTGACEIECPKEISVEYISKMNKEYLSASIKSE